MKKELVGIATKLLLDAGPGGALTDHFWKDLILQAGDLAPIEADDRETLLLTMNADIVQTNGKNRIVFTDDQSR